MPKINLLPKEELNTRPIGRFLKWILSYGRYIITSVELVVFLVFFSRFIYDQKLADLKDEIEQKQAIVASASQFEHTFRLTQDKIAYIKSIDKDRLLYIQVLDILKKITPVQVSFDSVSFEENTLLLNGFAQTNESFAQFLAQLKKIDIFTSVTLDSLEKIEDEEQGIVFKCTIHIKNVSSTTNN